MIQRITCRVQRWRELWPRNKFSGSEKIMRNKSFERREDLGVIDFGTYSSSGKNKFLPLSFQSKCFIKKNV